MGVESLLRRLSRSFPPDRLLLGEAPLASFGSDALTVFHERPAAVLIPQNQDEVVALVRACHEEGVPFVARGSGTSLSGGSLPIAGGIVIALNRLNRILRVDPLERVAVVEPGVINLLVTEAARPYGLYYAPDPSSQPVCTIGGNLAFNSGGAHCLKHGMTCNHVLGLKVVLADGEVVHLGSESRERCGPDAVGLFVGSEGLFGIVLEATLKLQPPAECYHTVLAGYATLEQAGDAVTALVGSGLLPGAIEIMDRLTLEATQAAVGAKYPPGAEAVLIVELEGTREQIAADRRVLEKLVAASGPVGVTVAADESERLAIWKGRKSAFSAAGRLSADFIVQDGVVPRRRLGEALRFIDNLSREYGLRVANVFHAGDGNLHPLILFDGRVAGELERAEELASRILRLCIQMGGSITGEHGVGVEKRQYLPEMFDPQDMDLMHRIRRACDPKEIANRGKMFPGDQAPVLTRRGLHPLEAAGRISRE